MSVGFWFDTGVHTMQDIRPSSQQHSLPSLIVFVHFSRLRSSLSTGIFLYFEFTQWIPCGIGSSPSQSLYKPPNKAQILTSVIMFWWRIAHLLYYENDDDDDDIDGFVDVVREWEHDPEDDPAGAHSNQVNINTGLWSWDVVHRDSFDAVDLYQPWTYLLEQTWQPSRDYRQASVCDSQRMLDHRHLPHDVYHTISFEQRTTPLPVRIGNHVGTGITFPDYVKGLKATFCL
ncbi:hypothetical protein SISSUDRAFT_311228 [Sistotremastrum suecicum HHB10207 ss-3]|uniref:Uncharacterized protein n=1 Tax=Sistotremastrum suecicum HHB10207 ss-3 TaxID=1314776 RepID=A0A165ZCD8_9AGAM|nr:hypothetical protein SISSUDRAFT_311228 [Sistotremastrum suecicum HHB10207 ss-3]